MSIMTHFVAGHGLNSKNTALCHFFSNLLKELSHEIELGYETYGLMDLNNNILKLRGWRGLQMREDL